MTNNIGIDYGLGQSNIDQSTGIRFGVIAAHELGESWYESAESDYGEPTCGKCGNEATTSDTIDDPAVLDADWFDGRDFTCTDCEYCFWSDDTYGDTPNAFTYDADGIVAQQSGDDSDIFILKSPYYTHAQFCSPCAPGAGYLMNPVADGPKTYCFGHDWFENGTAPYPIFNVADGAEVAA